MRSNGGTASRRWFNNGNVLCIIRNTVTRVQCDAVTFGGRHDNTCSPRLADRVRPARFGVSKPSVYIIQRDTTVHQAETYKIRGRDEHT